MPIKLKPSKSLQYTPSGRAVTSREFCTFTASCNSNHKPFIEVYWLASTINAIAWCCKGTGNKALSTISHYKAV